MFAFRVKRLLGGALAVLALCGLAASDARAEIFARLNTVTGSPGNYTWSYTPSLVTDSTAQTGDYFELVGFKGFNGSHSEPAGWTFQSSTGGPTPTGLSPTESSTAPNLVWQYTGSTPLAGPLTLGTFTAGSTLGGIAMGQIVAQTTSANDSNSGSPFQNMATVQVPGPGTPSDTVVPEPGALLIWMAASLPLAWIGRRHMLRAA
jgi:hypothetical protein